MIAVRSRRSRRTPPSIESGQMPLPDLLRDLLATPGPSGQEAAPARVWREAAAAFAEVSTDALGSSLARVAGTGGGPLLALVAHIDEIGLVVTHVSDEGYLFFRPLGGWNPQVLLGQRVTLLGPDGPVPALVGRKWIPAPKPGEERKRVELDDLHLDLGARSREEALECVRLGDVAVVTAEPVELPNERIAARAVDDRVGAYVVLEAARRIAEAGGAPGDVVAAAVVGEEDGDYSGSRTAVFGLGPAVAVIVSAVRTPFGKLGGSLADKPATELGAIVIRAALERAGLEPGEVEYVIMGQVLQAGAGQAPARQAAIGAGIPIEVGADTINKVCASSIRAVEMADQMIRAGDHELIVTGGMESMSNTPYLLKKARFGYRLGNGELIDSMIFDGLTSTFDKLHMVQQASKVARELGVSREDQDGWALRSHERAVRAIDEGRFADEIVAVGEFAVDEGPRRDTSLERLSALKPVFDPEGTTTAGNAPGVNDGAGRLIVASEELARRRNGGGVGLAAICSGGGQGDAVLIEV